MTARLEKENNHNFYIANKCRSRCRCRRRPSIAFETVNSIHYRSSFHIREQIYTCNLFSVFFPIFSALWFDSFGITMVNGGEHSRGKNGNTFEEELCPTSLLCVALALNLIFFIQRHRCTFSALSI